MPDDPIKPMKPQTLRSRTLRLAAPLLLSAGLAHGVSLEVPAVADMTVTENDGLDGAGPAAATDVNARFNNSTRNEIIALRFDLTGYDRASIQGAAVRLVNQRSNSTSSNSLRIYGVNDDATGYNADTSTEGTATDDNWPEDETMTTFSTTPGLEFDADSTTRGVRLDRVTDLGSASTAPTTEGSVVSIGTSALRDFIINHPDDVVTILVEMVTPASGQMRYATKEATSLLSGGAAPAGTYAPKLALDFPGVSIQASADTQLNEQNNSNSNGGTGTQLNARWIPNATPGSGNNEIIAMRFDLTGYDPADILGAEVRLTNYRNNTTSNSFQFYGVIDGSTGYDATTTTEGPYTDDDWPEDTTLFSTFPGVEYDGITNTAGIRGDRTVNLGSVSVGSGNQNKGTQVVLTGSTLTDFLKNHPDNLITIFVVDPSNGSEGQKRMASRETTLLDGDTAPEPAGTYAPEIRLLVANIDRDGDGLLNNWEELYGLNPDSDDSDGDFILDGDEDEDADDLTNLEEQEKGTDPTDDDTDDDFLTDGVEDGGGFWYSELATGTNPLVPDTDGDGLLDGYETNSFYYNDPTDTGTDPNLIDSDEDLYSDAAEIARGTEPNDYLEFPDDALLEIVGTGNGALLGSPLTDPDNNIDDSTAPGSGFNWVAVTASEKEFFGTGSLQVNPENLSGAYDLFDHKVGQLNDKWLAGVNAPTGAHVTVEFAGTVELTHFTFASADDRPERDPTDWQILGSNDGVSFTPIFTQLDPADLSLFTARYQVIRCTLADTAPAYRFLRFECTNAGSENQVHLNEIEYFGTFTPDLVAAPFRIVSLVGGPDDMDLTLTWNSQPGATYRIGYSATLSDGFAGTAAADVPADAVQGTTSHTFPNPTPGASPLFLRVETTTP